MNAPLSGIKIIDLTRVLAGPYATMLLYDMGAEVIKVEMPGKGDDARAFGPFKDDESLYFASFNRGKKSISLNLKTDEGKKILKDLLAKADVVVENFRPGTMEKLGLGYEDLKEINPKLIYAATSGFGHTGPDSSLPAYDILVQARGGIMSMTGWPDTPPTRVGCSFGDLAAGMFTAFGIVNALYQRTLTGKGQKVDVSMLDCQAALLENAIVRYQVQGESPAPLGNRHPSLAPFQAFKAKDKYFVVAVGNDALWAKFCNTLNVPEKITDERYLTNDLRTSHVKDMEQELSAVFAEKNADAWVEIIGSAGVPCALINDVAALMQDEQIKARNMLVDMEGIKLPGNPVKLSNMEEVKEFPRPPLVGGDNIEVLSSWLGYTQENIDDLKQKGVL
ncbi:MAG: CoA transferase [Alphaproteobacteria bacterium]|nr:CoA transferase [Alphaproteobacteria bacterium]